MLLYNITFGIDKDIEAVWIPWIKEHYVLPTLETRLFFDYKIYKVLSHEDEGSVSYSIQLYANKIENVVDYLDNHSPQLIAKHKAQFADKHVAFNTLLEEV